MTTTLLIETERGAFDQGFHAPPEDLIAAIRGDAQRFRAELVPGYGDGIDFVLVRLPLETRPYEAPKLFEDCLYAATDAGLVQSAAWRVPSDAAIKKAIAETWEA